MGRFSAVTRHVTQHVRCAVFTKAGGRCKAMTNYECANCGEGICGRHTDNHQCGTVRVKK